MAWKCETEVFYKIESKLELFAGVEQGKVVKLPFKIVNEICLNNAGNKLSAIKQLREEIASRADFTPWLKDAKQVIEDCWEITFGGENG